MQSTSKIIFSVLLVSSSLAHAQDRGLMVGIVGNDRSYQLTTNFGIEQWEEGKLTTHRRQQWWLTCNYPEPIGKRPETWCSLDRVVIDQPLPPSPGSMIGAHKHFTSDGTLRIVRADWPSGILDFTIVLQDRSNIEVMARMNIRDNLIILDSFKATSIARGLWSGKMSTIDFKIPKYSYTLSTPIELRGIRTADDKEWDEMLATLSKQDQHLWQEFRANKLSGCITTTNKSNDEVLRATIPNYETRKVEIEKGHAITADEKSRISQKISLLFVDNVEKCLANSGISPSGKKKIIAVFRKQMATTK